MIQNHQQIISKDIVISADPKIEILWKFAIKNAEEEHIYIVLLTLKWHNIT
jgi:hypothetical protein